MQLQLVGSKISRKRLPAPSQIVVSVQSGKGTTCVIQEQVFGSKTFLVSIPFPSHTRSSLQLGGSEQSISLDV